MALRVNSDRENLAARLSEARSAADLTQRELGDLLGVSTRTVQYWESGKEPRAKHRRAIRQFLEQVAA
jgi:transcriptional regulator with XRE-family HTH domain